MQAIREVDLTEYDFQLPSEQVGIVLLQPHLVLTGEPFKVQPLKIEAQLAAIRKTLSVSKAAPHEAGKTHFTIFPEYSVPGLLGVATIEDGMRGDDWPCGTIVIGGIDALTKEEFSALCVAPETYVDTELNGPTQIPDGHWINCCVTWVKLPTGRLLRWVQPKLCPAWPERALEHAYMFSGQSVYLFKCAFESGRPCRFFSLLCFDWIGISGEHAIPKQVLAKINERNADVTLSWVFVLQHNDDPCNVAFLRGAADFFNDQQFAPSVLRTRCAVVFANTAGAPSPKRVTHHGRSGIVFDVNAFDGRGCHPTYCCDTQLMRGNNLLNRCIDAVFREGSECIHAFSQLVPGSVRQDVAGRSVPIPRALVWSLTEDASDPRTPNSFVPGCVKWINDNLDDKLFFSHYVPSQLGPQLDEIQKKVICRLRSQSSTAIDTNVDCSAWREPNSRRLNADEWSTLHEDGLCHLVDALSLSELSGFSLEVSRDGVQAAGAIRDIAFELRAVSGPTHEECAQHAERFARSSRAPLVIVSKDQHNSPLYARDRNFTRPARQPGETINYKITDVASGTVQIAFQELVQLYCTVESQQKMEEAVYGKLAN